MPALDCAYEEPRAHKGYEASLLLGELLLASKAGAWPGGRPWQLAHLRGRPATAAPNAHGAPRR